MGNVFNDIYMHMHEHAIECYHKFQVHLIDLSQSGIQVLYALQIDNDIRQCVNSS